jgi:hypothetical protein
MAPFQVGDYIEYSGILVGGQIICYAITATSVQILTPPSGPVYIRMEDANIGVFDPSFASEFGDTKFVGFVSDPSVTVTISAIDVDPCTGLETDRLVGSSQPVAGNPRNRFIWRADSTTLSHYTREYRIKVSSGTQTTNQGILAGQYVQPVTEWIYPEPLTPGIITPPINFDVFDFLANGWNLDGKTYGQLNPWPGKYFEIPTTTKLGTNMEKVSLHQQPVPYPALSQVEHQLHPQPQLQRLPVAPRSLPSQAASSPSSAPI